MDISQHFNFVESVLEQANATSAAFIQGDQVLTYGQLAKNIRSTATWLAGQGLHPEQRVAIIMRDGSDMATIILACMYAGMVAVPLDPRSSIGNLRHCVDHSGSKLVITEDHEIKEKLELSGVTVHTRGVTDHAYRCQLASPTRTHRDAAAIFMYTSGTTGHPKAVVHSQSAPWIIGNSMGQQTLGWRADDISFATAKLFFSFGLFNLWNTLVAGAATIFNPGISMPNVLADIITQHKPTIMISVPALWGKLLRYDLSGNALRICLSGGDRLPPTLITAWMSHTNLYLYNIYGSTETGTAFTYCDRLDRPGSIGRAVSGYDLEIRDNELFVRAPSAGICYWHDREWSARMFGEWMPTGDIVSRDKDGYYYYLGRASDVVKVNGKYVDMANLEHLLMQCPGVSEAVVVGQQDALGHTRLKAYVVAESGQEPDTQNLGRHVRNNSTDFLREIELVDALPRTENGKVQRYKLRQLM